MLFCLRVILLRLRYAYAMIAARRDILFITSPDIITPMMLLIAAATDFDAMPLRYDYDYDFTSRHACDYGDTLMLRFRRAAASAYAAYAYAAFAAIFARYVAFFIAAMLRFDTLTRAAIGAAAIRRHTLIDFHTLLLILPCHCLPPPLRHFSMPRRCRYACHAR